MNRPIREWHLVYEEDRTEEGKDAFSVNSARSFGLIYKVKLELLLYIIYKNQFQVDHNLKSEKIKQ